MPFQVEVEGLPTPIEFDDGTPEAVVKQVVRRESMAAAAQPGVAAKRTLGVLGPLTDLVYGATPQGLAQSAGWALNYTGRVASGLAQDLAAGDTTMPRTGLTAMGEEAPKALQPQTPIGQGLAAGVEGMPAFAAGLGAMALGVPAAIALGGPMAVSTFAHARERGATDAQAASQAAFAGAVGSVLPGVAQAGGQGVARILGQAVQRGLLGTSATMRQKALEMLGSQGVAQVFMEGLNLPEYAAAEPAGRWAMLQRNIAQNAVGILTLDVPNVVSAKPSLTQQRVFAKVGEVLNELSSTKEGQDALQEMVDEIAVEQTALDALRAGRRPDDAEPPTPKEVIEGGLQGQKEEGQEVAGRLRLPEDQAAARAELEAEQAALGSPDTPPVLGAPAVATGTLPPAAGGTLAPRVKARMQVEFVREGLAGMITAVGGTPVFRSRRFGQKALGIFKQFERVVRMRDMNDLPTLSHEVAHHVSRQLFNGDVRKAVPAPIANELQQLGRALYSTRKPDGGYTEEGWAEFWRHYLTTDVIDKAAPLTKAWVEGTLFKGQPALANTAAEARRRIDTWRSMDPRERWGQVNEPTETQRKIARLKRSFSVQGQLEAAWPLRELAKTAEGLLGRPLRPSENPYLLHKAQRARAGSVVRYMMEEGMVDAFYQRTGGKSLAEELAPVLANKAKGESDSQRTTDFFRFLHARRAKERWAKGKNPGIPQNEVDGMYDALVRPEFLLAAEGYDRWWAGVLDYVASSSPSMAALVESIRQGSTDYAPLARLVDDQRMGGGLGVPGASNPFMPFGGSSKSVLKIQTQTVLSAERLIQAAHREQVMEAVYQLAKEVPGLGGMIERVPAERRQMGVELGKLREQLEAEGIDTSAVPDDTLLTYYQAAPQPSGGDSIIIRRQKTLPGQPPAPLEWYHVNRNLYDVIAGMRPMDIGPLGTIVEMAARFARLGSTGLRPSFGLVSNPQMDLPTALIQAKTSANPFGFLRDYFLGLGDMFMGGVMGKDTALWDAYKRAGVSGSTYLGADTSAARTAGKRLFRGRIMRRITTPIESYRELIAATEALPRLAEMRRIGAELGWVPGTQASPDQAILMLLAASEVTTDFRARGDFGGDSVLAAWQRGQTFNLAALQGIRTFARGIASMANPRTAAKVVANGIGFVLLPTVLNWYLNKDKEWYRALSAQDRLNNWHVELGSGEVLVIRKPREWGAVFAGLPEVLLSRAFDQDPLAAKDVVRWLYNTFQPYSLPTVAQFAKENLSNHVDYWDKPIVPKSRLNLSPGAQTGPYTSAFAKRVGELFPDTFSPLKVDHAVRSLMGGAPMDVVQFFGLKEKQALRGKELSDMFLIGRLWRRGGTFSANSRWLDEAYRMGEEWKTALASQEVFPLAPRDIANSEFAVANVEAIQAAQQIIEMSPDPVQRRALYEHLNGRVKAFVKDAQAKKALPEDRTRSPRQRPVLEQLRRQQRGLEP